MHLVWQKKEKTEKNKNEAKHAHFKWKCAKKYSRIESLYFSNVSYAQGKAAAQMKDEEPRTSYDSPGKYLLKCTFIESVVLFL